MDLHRHLAAITLYLTTACAQDITDIDRTYPNKVHKSMFNGTWYFRGTVTEVAPDMAGVFEGVATGMSNSRRVQRRVRGWSTNETVIGMDQEIDDCRRIKTVQSDGRINIEETFDDECMKRSALEGTTQPRRLPHTVGPTTRRLQRLHDHHLSDHQSL